MSNVSSAVETSGGQSAQPHVIDVLRERGLLSQMTESGLEQDSAAQQLLAYCGFDPTAPSLHVGNLVPVMALAHFQRHGHRPILVVGGGTGMIGDPSGKSTERPLLTPEQVAEYSARIRDQLARYLSFEGPSAAIMVNNADWLNRMTLIEYLRDIGKHFSVNVMLAKESVKSRLEDREQGISYTEFSYMIVQATDYLHLFDTLGCTVQVGGHDQWGNLTAGVDLIRRTRDARVHAMTVPLITSATGQKFGKSEGNALYLDPAMTTPYAMYQYWINVDDRDVGHYLKVFTFLPLSEIAELERQQAEDPASRVAQRRLAFEVTALIHGEETARAVEAASDVLFGRETEAISSVATTATPRVWTLSERLQSPEDWDLAQRLHELMPPFDDRAIQLLRDLVPSPLVGQVSQRLQSVPPTQRELQEAKELQRYAPTNPELQQAKELQKYAPTREEWQSARQLQEKALAVIGHSGNAVPTPRIDQAEVTNGLPMVDLLLRIGAQPSKGAARRLIQQGGLYVNGERWTNPDTSLTLNNTLPDGQVLIRVGKNRWYVVVIT